MRKPLWLRLLAAAERRRPGLARGVLEHTMRRALSSRGMGARLRGVLSRVLRWKGQEPSPESLDELLRELAGVYVDCLLSLAALEPASGAAKMPAGLEKLQALRAEGRGAILFSAHFGNPIPPLAALAAAGVRVHILFMDAGPFRWLEPLGLVPLELGQSAADIARALKDGGLVWINGDLDFFPDERRAGFFGAPVPPPHAAARLALACGAPLLPVYPVGGAGQWRLHCEDPIRPDGRAQEELEEALLRSLERAIGRHPGRWWLMQDPWNAQETAASNRRMLKLLSAKKALDRLLD